MKEANRIYAGVFLLLLLAIPCHLQARIYKWYDDAGKVHYSQAPPPKGSVQTSINADTFSSVEMKKAPPVRTITRKRTRTKRTVIRKCPNR